MQGKPGLHQKYKQKRTDHIRDHAKDVDVPVRLCTVCKFYIVRGEESKCPKCGAFMKKTTIKVRKV